MHDPWTDRLSEYIDGDLAGADRIALEEHLAACETCHHIVAELRQVTAEAASLHDREPPRDLWQGIAARIAPAEAVTPLRSRRARRFSFSVPQLAAAAVLIMALTGTAVWYAGVRTSGPELATGTILQNAGGSARTVASQPLPEPEFPDDVTALERALDENRARLDPATVEVIERSLDSIDRAIEDARTALESDPGNPYLHRQLDNTMRKKVDILRRATRAS